MEYQVKKVAEKTFIREGKCSVNDPCTPLQIIRHFAIDALYNALPWNANYPGEPGASKLRKFKITMKVKVEYLDD